MVPPLFEGSGLVITAVRVTGGQALVSDNFFEVLRFMMDEFMLVSSLPAQKQVRSSEEPWIGGAVGELVGGVGAIVSSFLPLRSFTSLRPFCVGN